MMLHRYNHDFNGATVMIAKMIAFIGDEDGATAIEYGLIAALVSVAAIGALTAMGNSLSTMFNTVSTALQTATSGG
jgi:pilus assembly protein Flp/PilA